MPLNSNITSGAAAVSAINQALFNAGPGNSQYLQQQQYVLQNGAFQYAKDIVNQAFSGVANTTLTTQVLNNIGITRNTVSDISYNGLRDALNLFFDVYPNDRGVVILRLVDILTGRGSSLGAVIESDGTYGNVAINFNNIVNNRFAYSSNASNSVPQTGGATEFTNSSFTLTPSSVAVDEGGFLTFTLLASSNVSVDTNFNFQVVGSTRGGAVALGSSADISPVTGTVVVKAGTNGVTFRVDALADGITEPVEGFLVNVTNAQGNLITSSPFSITANNASLLLAQNVSAAAVGPFNAASNDVLFSFATGEYASQITGFGRGDALNFFPNETALLSLVNTTPGDGQIAITATSSSGQQVFVTLTGLSQADDAAVFGINSFRAVFGADSLVA